MVRKSLVMLSVLLMLTPVAACAAGEDGAPLEGKASRAVVEIGDVYSLQMMAFGTTHNYYLVNDIDASETRNWNGGLGFNPIGNQSGGYMGGPPLFQMVFPNIFKGTFDGKGHKITNLYINRPSEFAVGLFGYIQGAVISNVELFCINITGGAMTGGLVGYHMGGSLTNCSTSGKVAGSSHVGGIAGRGDATINRCYSAADVRGSNGVGGFVGYTQTSISNCHASGSVTGGNGGDFYGIGGFVGSDMNSALVNCFSTGNVTGSGYTGGFEGDTYYGTGTRANCFWDNVTSGWTTSDGGAGRNTSDLMKQATFGGYDFSTIWGIVDNQSYPYLLGHILSPEILSTDVPSAMEDASYVAHIDVFFSQYPSNNNITWTFSTNATGWLNFNTTTWNLSGTPDNSHVGSYWVNLSVRDLYGFNTSRNFTLTVINSPPVFTNVPPAGGLSVNQDAQLQFDLNCSDEGQGPAIYDFVRAPDWLTINKTAGVISGTPGNDDVGQYTVVVYAEDGWGGGAGAVFNLTVVDVNDAPVITTAYLLTATQGVAYSAVYQATDIDPVKETFTWSLGTNAGWLTMDSVTGLLSGVPSNADVGAWYVNVSVSDGRGLTDSENFTVTVANVNDLPTITAKVVLVATQGAEYLVDFNETDIDAGETFTWSVDTLADWLSINATTGVLSGTPGEKDVGTAYVTVTVSDASGANASIGYSIRVLNFNDRPVWVSVAADANLTEGSWLFADVVASDPDAGESVRYSISSVPVCGIAVNPVSGAIRWTNVTVGNYTVTVVATSGTDTIETVFNLTVKALPVPPPPPPPPVPPANIVPVIGTIGDRQATEGKALSIQITGTDADSWDARNLTFRLVNPQAGMAISADGMLSWTPAKEQVGVRPVTVSLSDGKNATTTSFNVTVAKSTTTTGGKATESGYSTGSMAGIAILMLVIGLAVGAVIVYSSRPKKEGAPDDGKEEE